MKTTTDSKELNLPHGNQYSKTIKNNQLTPRQDLVMRLLAQGLRSKDIADRLKTHPRNVASVLECIRETMGANTTLQAMAWWAVADYIEANEEE